MYDQQLLNFHNKLQMLALKKSQIESRSYMSALAPDKPVKQKLNIWFENNEFKGVYNEISNKYFEFVDIKEGNAQTQRYSRQFG